jgi:hypothetical protein
VAEPGVPRTGWRSDVGGRSFGPVLYRRWRWALRSRFAGRGCKPPQAASVKSRGGERCGKGGQSVRQVWIEKASESEPSLTCRNAEDGIKTEGHGSPRDELGGYLSTAQVVPGMEVARARFRLRYGTWEPVAPMLSAVQWTYRVRWPREGGPQAAITGRGRVPMRGTGTDRIVVAVMLGNASGAKEADCPGSFDGQPPSGGRSR